MVISVTTDRLLKSLPPDVVLEPNYFFFDFLMNHADVTNNETLSDKTTLLQQFTKYVISDLGEKQFLKRKKELESIFNNLLSKIKNIAVTENNNILEFNWDSFDKFFTLLKHIKKSNERIIQWAIYYLFSAGEAEIEMLRLGKFLTKFNIKNLNGLVQKIVDDAEDEGLRIKYENARIIIEHKTSDPIVKRCLADLLEFYFRRPRRGLEQEILGLLDSNSYSNQEIAKILDTDKSQVSKTMTKLLESEEIKFVDFGSRGSRYYITNCSNCPFGTNYESCRKDAIESISKILKDELDIRISADDLNQIKHNQSLLNIKDILVNLKKNKKTKLANEINENLRKIFGLAIDNSIKRQTARGNKYANLNPILDKTPPLYRIGFTHGTVVGVNLLRTIISQVDPELAKKFEKKNTQAKLLQELKKIRTIE